MTYDEFKAAVKAHEQRSMYEYSLWLKRNYPTSHYSEVNNEANWEAYLRDGYNWSKVSK